MTSEPYWETSKHPRWSFLWEQIEMKLFLRPIISNTNTGSYQLAKYLANLLSPLSTSEYTIKSTSDFITHIKGKNIPNSFKLISFDVTSLFTNVPLDVMIDVILKQIFDKNEVKTNIPKQQMRDLLLLCTRNVHFICNGRHIYTSRRCGNGFAVGSSACRYIYGWIRKNNFERTYDCIEKVCRWHLSYVKEEPIEHVLSKSNGYHENIYFTYEIENDGKLLFLDVLVISKEYEVETTVYRNSANNDIYLHW